MTSGKQHLQACTRHLCCTTPMTRNGSMATSSVLKVAMKRRQVPSAYRRVRRAASLLAVVALALCPTASSFVVPHPPALSTHSAPARGSNNRSGSTCSASTGGGTVRRQRSSDQASSKMMEAATGAGDTDRAWQGITVTGPEGIPTLEGESLGGIMTAEGAAVFPTAAGATAASAGGGDGGRASLLALSNAPARTEIPTDVAVVGAPQQVGGGRWALRRDRTCLPLFVSLRRT